MNNTTYCTNCGVSNVNSAKFCSACGNDIVFALNNNNELSKDRFSTNFKMNFSRNKIEILCLLTGFIAFSFLNKLIDLILIELNTEVAHNFDSSFFAFMLIKLISIYVILISIQSLNGQTTSIKSYPFISIGMGLLFFALTQRSYIFYDLILGGGNYYENPNYEIINKLYPIFMIVFKIGSFILTLYGLSRLEYFKKFYNSLKLKINFMAATFCIGAAISVFFPWFNTKAESHVFGLGSNFEGDFSAGYTGLEIGYGIFGLMLSIVTFIFCIIQRKYVLIFGVIMAIDSLTYLLTIGTFKAKGSYNGSASMGEYGQYSINSSTEVNITPQYGLLIFVLCSIAIILFSFKEFKFKQN